MQKTIKVWVILIYCLNISNFSFAAGKKSSVESYLEELHNQGKERVIVRFNGQIDPNLVTKYQGKVIRKLKIINAVVCEIDQAAIELLRRQPNVKDVVPDSVIKIPEPVEREAPSQIMPLSYPGPVTPAWENLAAGLNSKSAWDRYDLDGNSIKVAFLDTGINYGADPNWPLPDLDAHYLGGYDFVDDDNDPMPYIHPTDPDLTEWHGTSIAANCLGEGESQVVGMAYIASYYSLRILEGPEAQGYVSDGIAALEWCLDPDGNPATTSDRPYIINMSFGAYGEGSEKIALEAACNAAYNAGIILVAASGNDGYSYSAWPASFANVISVGGHAEDQTLYSHNGHGSNGRVDFVAPGAYITALSPENILYHAWGTSGATACSSGLAALQLQYARQNSIQPNNGYLWEVMKHSAVDMPLIPDPNNPGAPDPYSYKGKGKVWAAGTDVNDANIGSIGLIASNWPIDYGFQFFDYAFMDGNRPVYQIGSDVNQTITITNVTDIFGNTVETIENLKVIAMQVHYGEPNEPNLPGDSVKVFPTIATLGAGEANSISLSYVYTIPAETEPGVKKTKLEFEFNFAGNSRVIKITYYEPDSLWYAAIPADLDLKDGVTLLDFSILAGMWLENGCTGPNWCNRADVDRSGDVGWSDVKVLADKWLVGIE